MIIIIRHIIFQRLIIIYLYAYKNNDNFCRLGEAFISYFIRVKRLVKNRSFDFRAIYYSHRKRFKKIHIKLYRHYYRYNINYKLILSTKNY